MPNSRSAYISVIDSSHLCGGKARLALHDSAQALTRLRFEIRKMDAGECANAPKCCSDVYNVDKKETTINEGEYAYVPMNHL